MSVFFNKQDSHTTYPANDCRNLPVYSFSQAILWCALDAQYGGNRRIERRAGVPGRIDQKTEIDCDNRFYRPASHLWGVNFHICL